jgi:SAM-dependent methyltransferase
VLGSVCDADRVEVLKGLPADSVRGRIRSWIETHAHHLGPRVLEVGSRQHDGAWWVNNRDLAKDSWFGIDMQHGPGVDMVADMESTQFSFRPFSGVLCSEVLEHVKSPARVLKNIWLSLEPGGMLIITTLTCFPIHAFPDDYWRFTESGLALLLDEAGFVDVETGAAGEVQFSLNDHGEARNSRLSCPMHVFAVARRPL